MQQTTERPTALSPELANTCRVLGYKPRPAQVRIHQLLESHRFVVAATHRRMGKSVAAAVQCFRWCLYPSHHRAQVAFLAPTREQARRVIWGYLTQFASRVPGVEIRKLELALAFPTGATLMLLGSDRADSLRGMYLNAAVVDEAAYSRPYSWHSVLRPALSDYRGPCLFTSTPNGHDDLFWRLFEYAGTEEARDWARIQLSATETGIIPDDELREARASMTEAAFRREFLVDFGVAPEFSVYGDVVAGMLDSLPDDVEPLRPDDRFTVFAGLTNTDAVALWLVHYREGAVRFLDYWFEQGQAFERATAQLRRWSKRWKLNGIVIPTSAYQRPDLSARVERLEEIAPIIIGEEPPLMDGVERVRAVLRDETEFVSPEAAVGFDDLIQLRFSHDPKSGELRESFAPCRYDPVDLALRVGFATPPETDDAEIELDYAWVV